LSGRPFFVVRAPRHIDTRKVRVASREFRFDTKAACFDGGTLKGAMSFEELDEKLAKILKRQGVSRS
jgi:hypothetical protein